MPARWSRSSRPPHGALSRKAAGQGRGDLAGLVKQVLAVDGTFFAAAAVDLRVEPRPEILA